MKFLGSPLLFLASLCVTQGEWTYERCPVPRTRKNVLNLSRWERQEFFTAIKKIKSTGEYDVLVKQYMDVYQGIHGGNLYLPFHRHFLKRVEQSMQKYYPSVNLPYWDYTADWAAPHFSPALELMGYGGGNGRLKSCINDGPLKNFQMNVPEKRCVKRGYFKNEVVSAFMNEVALDNILKYSETFPKINSMLKGVNGMVTYPLGGDIRNVQLMVNDPLYFLIQANTDRLWTRWQHLHPDHEIYMPDVELNPWKVQIKSIWRPSSKNMCYQYLNQVKERTEIDYWVELFDAYFRGSLRLARSLSPEISGLVVFWWFSYSK
ncbi:hypothetical protein K7432_005932 [Basidiobolus ranarum]|uniref:Tyrosinase copper-binding domain-containing protein n=1 Tax=Basidiobolus ranarum TaxID=34480 RepID=A0ABR2W3C9_9FUNG